MDKHFTQSQLVHSAICEVWNWNWQIICPQGYCSQLTPPKKLMTSYTWEFTKELYWQLKKMFSFSVYYKQFSFTYEKSSDLKVHLGLCLFHTYLFHFTERYNITSFTVVLIYTCTYSCLKLTWHSLTNHLLADTLSFLI